MEFPVAASKALETALRQRICGARGLSKSRPAPARDIQHIDVLTLCVVPQLPTTSQGLMATEDISAWFLKLVSPRLDELKIDLRRQLEEQSFKIKARR